MDTKKALKKAIKVMKKVAKSQRDWIELCEENMTPGERDDDRAKYDELMQIKEVLEGLKEIAIGVDWRDAAGDFYRTGVGFVTIGDQFSDETTTP